MRLVRKIKYFIQRGIKGYSDEDVWSVDFYLATIIPKMLRELIKPRSGYPSTLKSMEEWEKIVNGIADGFDAYIENECDVLIEGTPTNKQFKKTMQEFIKWFGAYWN